MWYRVRRAWKFEESGASSGIYKSIDGGQTWNHVSAAGSGFMKGEKIGRIGITVYPQNPQIVYAVVDNNTPLPAKEKKDSSYEKADLKNLTKDQFTQLNVARLDSFLKKNRFPRNQNAKSIMEKVANGELSPTAVWDWLDSDDGFQNTGIAGCEVYRSEDGGLHWKKTHEKPIGIFNTYGYYFAKIYTSAYNPDKVFILGFSAQYSIDGGKSFRNMDKGNVHADHHALWINPQRDSHVINGNDGGCNISYDNGKKWSFSSEAQLRSLQFYKNYNYHEYKGIVGYKLIPSLQTSLVFGRYTTFGSGKTFQNPKLAEEFRLALQLGLKNTIGKFQIDHRYRFEKRYYTSGARGIRIRYRLGLSTPLDKKKLTSLSFSNEFLIAINSGSSIT